MSKKLEVHPVADLFPMLAPDELRALTADIAGRGLLQPIVLDAEGRILDGRNRLAACELAGVAPTFEKYEGDDPDGYAVLVNIARRHLTKGQRAMIAARTLLKNSSQSEVAEKAGVSQQYVGQAKVVLDYATDLVDGVVSGVKPLHEAYGTARDRKDEKEQLAAGSTELSTEAPDLAAEVTEERLTLDEAQAILKERREDAERRDRVAEIDEIRDADGAPEPTFQQRAEDGAITWTEALTLAEQWLDERDAAIKRAADGFTRVAIHWGALRTIRDKAGTPYGDAIVNALGDADREALKKILDELKG